jgi:hypothetical protein
VGAAVALPAVFGLIGADGAFLAVADQAQLRGGDAHGDQEFLGGAGAAIAEGQVVLFRAALIGVAFDQQFLVGIVGQNVANDADVGLQNRGRIITNGGLIVVEQSVVLRSSGVRAVPRGVCAVCVGATVLLRCCMGAAWRSGGAEATGVVSAGLLATGAALWHAAVESRVANPNSAKDACFIQSSFSVRI